MDEEKLEKRLERIFYISLLLGTILVFLIAVKALVPDFEAISFLEGEGYTHVRILYIPAEGHGCQADDDFKRVFDAYARGAEKRSEGIVCRKGNFWYEDK